jgi:hypothetical protein
MVQQNITSQQPQPLLPQPLQAPPGNLLATESIPLADWNSYGFTIPASRIRSWLSQARVNGIMREGAVLRFGQRYYVNPMQLYTWINRHGDRTRLTRGQRTRRQGETRAATDGKEQQLAGTAPQSPTESQTQVTGKRHQLTDAQVRQSRIQLARAAAGDQEKVIARLAKRYGFKEQTVREAALGRTYRHLPMPQAQPKQTKKTKAARAVETVAPA